MKAAPSRHLDRSLGVLLAEDANTDWRAAHLELVAAHLARAELESVRCCRRLSNIQGTICVLESNIVHMGMAHAKGLEADAKFEEQVSNMKKNIEVRQQKIL